MTNCSSEVQTKLMPEVFELILEKKLRERSGDTCDISEEEYLKMCSEHGLGYVMFSHFAKFVCEKASKNGWSVKYYNKKESEDNELFKFRSESEFEWSNEYNVMNTFALRVMMK